MCNTCNFPYANNSSTSSCNSGGVLSFLFGSCRQSICRDCCGNIHVNNASNRNGWGCGCCNSCNYCNGYNATANGRNGNGFSCFTVCGNNGVSASSQNSTFVNDAYYARQYGLSSGGRTNGCWRSCNCGVDVY